MLPLLMVIRYIQRSPLQWLLLLMRRYLIITILCLMQLLYEALLVNYMHLTGLISYEDILKFLVLVWIQKIFQIVQVFGTLFACA